MFRLLSFFLVICLDFFPSVESDRYATPNRHDCAHRFLRHIAWQAAGLSSLLSLPSRAHCWVSSWFPVSIIAFRRSGVLLSAIASCYKPNTVKATAELLVLARRPGSDAGAALGWPTVSP